MRHLFHWLIVPMLVLSGCHRDSGAAHGHDHAENKAAPVQSAKPEGAVFKEGHGILLGDETKKSLGLKLAEVAEKDISHEVRTTAQVYREAGEKIRPSAHALAGHAYASAMVSSEEAGLMKEGQTVRVSTQVGGSDRSARLVHIESELAFYTGRTEILIEIADKENQIQVGNRLELAVHVGQRQRAITVPASALLKASEGDFVYVLNGEHLLRTSVKVGVVGKSEIEITEGLYAGDTVAADPVESLWLIELRATKGGGHSH